MAQRRGELHALRLAGDVARERLHVGGRPGSRERVFHRVLGLEALQRHHAGDDARFEILHAVGIGEVTRQLREGALHHARAQAQIALLERGVLRAARRSSTALRRAPRTGPPGCPRRAAAGSARSPSACPAAPRRRRAALPPALLPGLRPAGGTPSSFSSRAPYPPPMTTSSVLRSPMLSTQLMVTFSPGLPL